MEKRTPYTRSNILLCNQNARIADNITDRPDSPFTRQDLIRLLRSYFVKDYITIGALSRKITPLLFGLSNLSNHSWLIHITINPDAQICTCHICCDPSHFVVCTIYINCVNSNDRRAYKQMLHQLFSKDRYCAGEYDDLSIRLRLGDNYYIYNKKLFRDDQNSPHTCQLALEPVSGWTNRWLRMVCAQDKILSLK